MWGSNVSDWGPVWSTTITLTWPILGQYYYDMTGHQVWQYIYWSGPNVGQYYIWLDPVWSNTITDHDPVWCCTVIWSGPSVGHKCNWSGPHVGQYYNWLGPCVEQYYKWSGTKVGQLLWILFTFLRQHICIIVCFLLKVKKFHDISVAVCDSVSLKQDCTECHIMCLPVRPEANNHVSLE